MLSWLRDNGTKDVAAALDLGVDAKYPATAYLVVILLCSSVVTVHKVICEKFSLVLIVAMMRVL